MMRKSAWLHVATAAYLWLLSCVSLGNWNAQPSPHLVASLMAGNPLDPGDVGFLLFVSLPAVLFWIAYRRSSFILAAIALAVDAFWLLMQIQSWWIPYLAGTHKAWQLAYAKGPTTKLLPSFGNHVAPDGAHLLISICLIAGMVTGLLGLRRLRQTKLSMGR
jgi:hypothetical protein